MRLLVFGATGQTGTAVVTEALARGHQVTAFARNPARLGEAASRVRVEQGDVADAAAVGRAIPSHDAVISTLGVGKPLNPDPAVVTGIRNIVAGMTQHRVRRLIYQSFIGVRESRHAVGPVLRFIAPLPLRHEISDHETKEALVRASSLEWTIVRPPKLTNGPRTGRYRIGEAISTWVPVPMLSRADVAQFIIDELERPAYIGRAPRLLH